MNNPVLIAIMIFCVLTLLIMGIFVYVRHVGERQKLLRRIETGEGISESAAPAAGQSLPFKTDVQNIVSRLGGFVAPKEEEKVASINRTFIQAGYRRKNLVVIFFGAKVLCAGLLSLSFLSFQLFMKKNIAMSTLMLISLGLVAVGFYLPNLWLRRKLKGRREQLNLGLPDALDLLVVCVEAGMGLDSALKRVGEEMKLSNKSISEEFGLLNLELRAGKSRRDALKSLASRTGLDEVNSLVTLLVQTEKFGTNVGQALRVHSDSMRAKRSQHAQELAAGLPIKLLFPTIFFIFPSLFVVLMGPALMRAYRLFISR